MYVDSTVSEAQDQFQLILGSSLISRPDLENIPFEIFVHIHGAKWAPSCKESPKRRGIIKGNGIKKAAKAECNFQYNTGCSRGFMGEI